MPVFIVFLGVLTALAGFAALILGIQNWAFGIGNTLIASGSIAAVGGLLLFGLGLVLRSLRTLAERIDALTPAISGEFQVPLVPQELPLEVEVPAPPPSVRAPVREKEREEEEEAPARSAALRRDEPFKRVREVAARIAQETKPVRTERSEPAPIADEPSETDSASQSFDQRRAWPPRTAVRPDEVVERRNSSPERPRATPQLRTPTPQTFTPPPAPEPEPEVEAEPEATPEPPTPVSIAVMRSGIISGMAYTLYSDGSIEAELPLGTVRFGSVEELRAHVARTGTDADAEFSGRNPAP
jgi:hypothetical protein